jgi:bifunctional non-homologous end joining protein LigD
VALREYRRKRDFERTPEPRGRGRRRPSAREPIFVVQRHSARSLHFDFRLQHGDVLWSWAVPKGPSRDPRVKRLAVRTEDHPLEYARFEGVIPKGEYGAGAVRVWDHGTWRPEGDPERGLARGVLDFTLAGEKLRGRWHLVRMRGDSWLLLKGRDTERCGTLRP